MERLIWDSLFLSVRVVLSGLLMPFVVARRLYHGTGLMAAGWVLATAESLPCPGCGRPVALTGRWECGRCRYVFDGFAFARCAVCAAVPPYIPCQACGIGLQNPLRLR